MKQLKYGKKSERGQAIVLVAFMMVGLIMMLGLAIDGGGLYFLQRDSQNAVDGAIVAATYAKCVGGDATAAATQALQKAGFQDGVDGTTIIVADNTPSADHITITLSPQKTPYFIQVLYGGDLRVTVKSTGKCIVTENTYAKVAIFGMSTECGFTVDTTGSDVTIDGGVHTNDDFNLHPSTKVINGEATYVNGNGETISTGTVKEGEVSPAPFTFSLNQFKAGGDIWDNPDVLDKRYIDATVMPAGKVKLEAADLHGLIFVNGDAEIAIKMSDVGPWTVTVVATGVISVGGMKTGDVITSYLNTLPSSVPKQERYTLFYSGLSAGCSNQGISISGSAASIYGLIYAPTSAVGFSNASGYYEGQIVAYGVNLSGSNMIIKYNDEIEPDLIKKVAVTE